MQISTRDFLKRLGLVGTVGAAHAVLGDQWTASKGTLPPGSVGDPLSPGFARHIFPLPHTIEDGPSCYLKDGKVFEPAREVPVFHETDVVVVGGGPAGFAAVVAAARTGVRVALVERYGSLGGLFTNGMVLIMLATSRKEAGGDWTLVTRGVCSEFMDRAVALGAHVARAAKRPGKSHWQPTVDPEGAKYLMDRMIAESKVEMFFHAWGVDTIQDGNRVLGVVFESKQGRQAVLAKQVVDCTGDGDMLFHAGGDYRQITHNIGHDVRLANMDRITAKNVPTDADGKPLPGPWPLRGNEANPATRWTNWRQAPLDKAGNGLDVRQLSETEVAFRKYWWEHVETMRKTPGWEQVFIANTCSQIGPRATRLIDTELITSRATLKENYAPNDVVGWFGNDGPHAAFPVAYRNIVPKKIDNLLCAGRCLGTGDTTDTFRLICPCFVTGQAAGVAAGLAARKGIAPRDLPYAELKKALEAQKVFLA